MADMIDRQAAIDVADAVWSVTGDKNVAKVWDQIKDLPSVTPKAEQTEYIPDTKAIPSEKDCVDLSERVTATFYDDEYKAWLQETVTIRDVLDSVCDEYTVLPSAQPEQRWIPVTLETLPNPNSVVVVCGKKGTWDYGTYRGWYGDIHSWWWKKNTIKHVYWWMYKIDALPEPYREEGGE